MTHLQTHTSRDEGRVTVFVTLFAALIVLLFALVLDGGLALGERNRALTLAQEAARAGAQELNLAAYRAGEPTRLATRDAEQAAHEFLRAAGAQGTVSANDDTVTVTTELTYTFTLLPLGERPVRGTASASPYTTTD